MNTKHTTNLFTKMLLSMALFSTVACLPRTSENREAKPKASNTIQGKILMNHTLPFWKLAVSEESGVLAVDREQNVYLLARSTPPRKIVSGYSLPVEQVSLGITWLSTGAALVPCLEDKSCARTGSSGVTGLLTLDRSSVNTHEDFHFAHAFTHGAPTRGIVDLPSLKRVLTYGDDGVLRLWEPDGWRLVDSFDLGGRVYDVVVVAADDKQAKIGSVGSGLEEGAAGAILDVRANGLEIHKLIGTTSHKVVLVGVADPVRGGCIFVGIAGDVWYTQDDQTTNAKVDGLTPLAGLWDSKRNLLFLGGMSTDEEEQKDFRIRIFRIPGFELIGYLEGAEGPVRDLALGSGGDVVFGASEDGTVRSWDLSSFEGDTVSDTVNPK